tara:strand:+ start:533 stop:649 length:117 start_codon:yes stop_codon:yes gene_type:complete
MTFIYVSIVVAALLMLGLARVVLAILGDIDRSRIHPAL